MKKGVLQNWLSVGMLHGASDVKALTIRGCTSVHPYAPIIITDSATPPYISAGSQPPTDFWSSRAESRNSAAVISLKKSRPWVVRMRGLSF